MRYIVGLINEMINNPKKQWTDKEIKKYFEDKTMIDFDFENFYYPERKGEEVIVQNKEKLFLPTVKEKVPIRPSENEVEFLYNMLKEPMITRLLSKDLQNKLCEKIENRRKRMEKYLHYGENYVRKNIQEHNSEKAMQELFSVIIEAITKKKKIQYSNKSRGVEYRNKIATPYRFFYSVRRNKLQLIVKPEKEERTVLINCDTMFQVTVTEQEADTNTERLLEQRKKILEVKVRDEKNFLERCFMLFSHLEKEARYDEEKNEHYIKITYYDFNDTELIRDILSLGSGIVVLKPEDIREKIIEEIKSAKEQYSF